MQGMHRILGGMTCPKTAVSVPDPGGAKTCGSPAVVNAVLDALNRGGHAISHIDMPLTPSRVWAAITT